jgi:hypothetical protein
MKDFKIRRYDYERTQKRKRTVKTALLTVVCVGVALVVGWFAYPPVYDFVTNFQMPQLSQEESLPDASSGDPASPSSESGSAGQEKPLAESPFPGSAAYLPLDVIKNSSRLESALAELSAKGIQGVVFDLKDASGIVHYQSGLELVQQNRAQAEDSYDLTQVMAAVREAGLVPVGRIFAFKDATAAGHMYDSAVKYMNSSVNWIDDYQENGGKSWLNPNDREAQDYIISIVEEAAGKGMDVLLLDGVQFPEGFSLELATYGNTGTLDKSGILAGFLTRARGAAEAKGSRIATTVNLLSAAGFSDVRYGDDVGSLVSAAGSVMVEAMPEQFGNGVTSEELTLSAPALDPYNTISQALAVCQETLLGDEEADVAAMVQAYTSTTLGSAVNKTYGTQEVQDQVRALQENGIENILYYNPQGDYSLIG